MRTVSISSLGFAAVSVLVLGIGCNSAHAGRALPEARSEVSADTQGARPGGSELADVVERTMPSIVSVQSIRTVRGGHPMGHFFGMQPEERKQPNLGSGVIVSRDGLVVTNNHVVEGADELLVKAHDGQEYPAKILGTDPKSDLALIKIDPGASPLRPISFGDSSRLRLGETVLAIGNSFGVGQTVTMGIVSAKGRADLGIADYEDSIQTDAAINPGNSGGALVNGRGELVGINMAIFSRSGGSEGVGFAIPSNMVTPIVDALKANGRVTRGYLGVTLQEMNRDLREALGLKETAGVLVADVAVGSPGASAGLLSGDVVTHVAGKPVDSAGRLRNEVASLGAGKAVELTLVRNKKAVRVNVVLGTLPSDQHRATSKAPAEDKAPDVEGVVLGELTPEIRDQLGVAKNVAGALVMRVAPGSKAAGAGLRRGDVVLEVNQRPVASAEEALAAYKGNSGPRLLVVLREGHRHFVVVK